MRMDGITQFFEEFLSRLSAINFPLLALIDFCAFGAVFIITLLFCIFSADARTRSKRVFLSMVNAFTAITFAVFASAFPLEKSVSAAALFWCLGYLMYGALCLFKAKRVKGYAVEAPTLPASAKPPRPTQVAPLQPPAAQSVVRLEHALSIADKLLLKNVGRGDRQELEKIKTSLSVLKVKGVLTPQDGETLNEAFNALLKLMAKYDI